MVVKMTFGDLAAAMRVVLEAGVIEIREKRGIKNVLEFRKDFYCLELNTIAQEQVSILITTY